MSERKNRKTSATAKRGYRPGLAIPAGAALGAGLGVALGVAFGDIAMGIAFGSAFGLVMGAIIDLYIRAQGGAKPRR